MTNESNSAEIERQKIFFLQKLLEMVRKDGKKNPPLEKEKTERIK